MKIQLIATLLILLATSIETAHTAETDNFSDRYEFLDSSSDSLDVINAETNQRIKNAIEKANKAKKCNADKLYDKVKSQFVWPSVSKFEKFARNNNEIDKRGPVFPTVYKYFDVKFIGKDFTMLNLGLMLNLNFEKKRSNSPAIKLNGIYLGTDKFSHFFTLGWKYFKKYRKGGLKAALKKGIATENGILGKLSGGIYSHADLVANYQGLMFYKDLLTNDGLGNMDKPYIECIDNRWVQVRQMNWTNYVDAGYDEGINCNSFRTKSLQEKFDKRISELEKESGTDLTCPIKPQECNMLVQKYGEIAPQLLHPKCLSAI